MGIIVEIRSTCFVFFIKLIKIINPHRQIRFRATRELIIHAIISNKEADVQLAEALLKNCCSGTFCLETPDCQVTFPINVIKRDVISSQHAASPHAQGGGARRGGREEVRYNTARQNAI